MVSEEGVGHGFQMVTSGHPRAIARGRPRPTLPRQQGPTHGEQDRRIDPSRTPSGGHRRRHAAILRERHADKGWWHPVH